MSGPPSLSKTSILAKTSGGATGTGAEGVERWQALRKVWVEGNKNSPSPQIKVPACTSIFALTIARNGLPKMIGT